MTILVVANNDLELLALRAAIEQLPDGFPPVRAFGGVGLAASTPAPDLDDVRVVLARLHKGRSAWEEPFDELRRACLDRGIALLAFGGETHIDADLVTRSTVATGIVTEAASYWNAGGPANLAQLLRFVADTVLLEGFGFAPPSPLAAVGVVRDRPHDPSRPTIAVVTYRANVLAGNTVAVEDLCDAIEARGANARAVHCYSLRAGEDGAEPEVLALLRDVDVVIATTWAAGGAVAAGDVRGDSWASPLDVLGVPVLQAVVATGARTTWESTNSHRPQNTPRAIWPVVSWRAPPRVVAGEMEGSGVFGQSLLNPHTANTTTTTGKASRSSSTLIMIAVHRRSLVQPAARWAQLQKRRYPATGDVDRMRNRRALSRGVPVRHSIVPSALALLRLVTALAGRVQGRARGTAADAQRRRSRDREYERAVGTSV